MDILLQGLRAAAEDTRLRILGLCAHAELTVSELVDILGQSQPRVSRHLKLLVEAGLLERQQEGSWAYYRLAQGRGQGDLARLIVDLMPTQGSVHALDLDRLEAVKQVWATKAEAYFKRNAADWARIRALHVDQQAVDTALLDLIEEAPVRDLLDVGTGAGHVLSLLADTIDNGVGVDRSRDMLNVARARIFREGLRHCHVRHAEMTKLPYANASFDVVTLHMVLHYAERPEAAIGECARVLRPGGRLLVVDFEEHERSELRELHAHRWLGFSESRIMGDFRAAGLLVDPAVRLSGGEITVCIWRGQRPANDLEEPRSQTQAGGEQ